MFMLRHGKWHCSTLLLCCILLITIGYAYNCDYDIIIDITIDSIFEKIKVEWQIIAVKHKMESVYFAPLIFLIVRNYLSQPLIFKHLHPPSFLKVKPQNPRPPPFCKRGAHYENQINLVVSEERIILKITVMNTRRGE